MLYRIRCTWVWLNVFACEYASKANHKLNIIGKKMYHSKRNLCFGTRSAFVLHKNTATQCVAANMSDVGPKYIVHCKKCLHWYKQYMVVLQRNCFLVNSLWFWYSSKGKSLGQSLLNLWASLWLSWWDETLLMEFKLLARNKLTFYSKTEHQSYSFTLYW